MSPLPLRRTPILAYNRAHGVYTQHTLHMSHEPLFLGSLPKANSIPSTLNVLVEQNK